MTEQPTALQLADWLDVRACGGDNWNAKMNAAAAELRRLHHNNEVLMNALWRACGDDEEVVNATIASEGKLK
jgi:hypothetical protein